MEGGNHWLLLLEFFGFAGLTVALGVHQLWLLKKYQLKQQEKERLAEQDAANAAN